MIGKWKAKRVGGYDPGPPSDDLNRIVDKLLKKNKAAVALGRKGGKATAAKLSPEQRQASASKAAKARWLKAKAQ